MKFLICTLFIYVAANAEPVPLTREQLVDTANDILQSIKNATESIDEVIAANENKANLELLRNKLVQNLKNTFEKIPNFYESECFEKSMLEDYPKLLNDVSQYVLQKVTSEKFGKTGDYINTLRKETSDLKNILEFHVDEEVESCHNEKSKCRLNDEFFTKSENYFTFELLKPEILDAINSSDIYYDSLEVGNKIVVKLTHPAHECLDKANA